LPLAEGIAEHRRVRLDGDWVKAARGTGVCLGDE